MKLFVLDQLSKIFSAFVKLFKSLTLFKCLLASLLSKPAKSVAKNDPTPVTRSMLNTGTHAVVKSSKRPMIHNYAMLLILKINTRYV